MNTPLSNEIWEQLYPDKFTLLHKLTKAAVEQIEKEQREDWELGPFLKEMHEALIATEKEKAAIAQEKRAAKKRHKEEVRQRLEERKQEA